MNRFCACMCVCNTEVTTTDCKSQVYILTLFLQLPYQRADVVALLQPRWVVLEDDSDINVLCIWFVITLLIIIIVRQQTHFTYIYVAFLHMVVGFCLFFLL